MFKHSSIGLYLPNSTNKKQIIEQIFENKLLSEHIDLSSMKGLLFSSITIERLIDDEIRHDYFPIQSDENNSLQSMSSGQRKKALLNFQIAQNPDYLVLDDVYSNIDKNTQTEITKLLHTLSESTLLVQLFFRKRDALSCLKTIYIIDNNNNIVGEKDTKLFLETENLNLKKEHQFILPELYNNSHYDAETLIQLHSVSVHYFDKNVLDNVNWRIKKGEFWQLIGPNGAGKSTLITLITGDNPRAYGQDIILFGRKKGTGESIWDIKRQIGYFTPTMIAQFTRDESVENMIISGLVDSVGLYTKPSDLQKDIAKSWLEMLGPTFRNKWFQQLSIGQQRMVMVVRAMVKQPPLLILDEPTIELDDENSLLFVEMIHAIAAEKKMAIIYVSHRDEEHLHPEKVFELIPTNNGFTGKIQS